MGCYSSLSRPNFFIRMIQDLFSFELVFTLFLFAWVFKADPRFGWVPVDLTLLLFIWSVCTGVLVFLAEKKRFETKATFMVFTAILFVLYILVSLTWTHGRIYAAQKALHISTLTLWSLMACAFIIASDKNRLARFIRFLMLLSIWIAAESTLVYIKGGNDVINALNSNYLALGYTMGMGLLISAAYCFLSGQSRPRRVLMLSLTLYFMFMLFIMGGRGPLLSVSISLCLPLLPGSNFFRSSKHKLQKYGIFIGILFLTLLFISITLYTRGLLTATLYRILLFLEPGMGSSAGTRMGYYSESYRLWQLKPLFGHGIGSWPLLIGLPDICAYPHNLIFELLVELGLSGVILFGLLLLAALKDFFKRNAGESIFYVSVILMMFSNAFIGALLSGDINDNRILFAAIGLMAFGRNINEKEGMCSYNGA
ncbi:MAG TPA: hypothetical protein DD738_14935 [Ruminiclostridium sp.]|nr:hypothetical protein [Ruminiclostridium sp.]